MSDKISVIVPIYNGEKYLARCLDSLQNQSWQNIEFLLIDDGSTDGSAAICRQYADNNPRFQYHYKENGGVSSARNLGLDLATGDFIGFCDCDDWVDSEFYKKMALSLTYNHADVAVSSFLVEPRDVNCFSKPLQTRFYTVEETIGALFSNGFVSGYVWQKLFTREVLETVRFNPEISLCEDVLFSVQAFCLAKTIFFCGERGYHYCMNEQSAIHTVSGKKCWSAFSAYEQTLHVVQSAGMDNLQLKQTLLGWGIYALIVMARERTLTGTYFKQYHQMIKPFCNHSVFLSLSQKDKIKLLSTFLPCFLFNIIFAH